MPYLLFLKEKQNLQFTLAHKHQFKILLKERCEIDYLHRLELTSMWSESGIINLLRSLLNFGNLGLMSCSKSADHLVRGQTVVQTDISFGKQHKQTK